MNRPQLKKNGFSAYPCQLPILFPVLCIGDFLNQFSQSDSRLLICEVIIVMGNIIDPSPASISSNVASISIPWPLHTDCFCKTWAIPSHNSNPGAKLKVSAAVTVKGGNTFIQQQQLVHQRSQECINVFGLLGTRYQHTSKNILNLVPLIWWKVEIYQDNRRNLVILHVGYLHSI